MNSRGRVLVTGGAGYIGSHTARALAEAGWTPVVFDNLSAGHRDAVRWGPFVRGDIRDETQIERAIVAHRITAVVHFAGLIEVGRSVMSPDDFYDHNVLGVANLLRAMKRHQVGRLVFSSTAAVYGIPASAGPLCEDAYLAPINPYGDTKLAAERMIAAHCAAFGLSAFALRYFNAAGAHPTSELGERHDPETHLIPLAIEAAISPVRPLTIFGDDFDTRDGTCVRDYIHVCDLADAHVAALSRLEQRTGFMACNLGSGQGHTVGEVIAAVERVTRRRVPRSIGARRPGDPPVLLANPARAQEALGWSARMSSLDSIVATAYRFRLARDIAINPPAEAAAPGRRAPQPKPAVPGKLPGGLAHA
jgi:UDP-glucose-4-epimerase GalE